MINFMYSIPNLLLFFIFIIFSLIFSLILILVVQKFISSDLRDKVNAVTGGASATISVIYAVLIGIAALFVLENFSSAERVVQNEANAAGDLYRDALWLAEPTRTNIRNNLKNYLAEVINEEWPNIIKGHVLSPRGNLLLNQITDELYVYKGKNISEAFIIHDILDEAKDIYNYREERMRLTGSALGEDVWLVIILSALIVIAINALYGEKFSLHFISIGAVAFVVSSMIFLVVAMDHPFLGGVSVKPEAYQYELAHMNQDYREFQR